jgi:putative NIF3 family GTP cyclohydrolase 1 type 2
MLGQLWELEDITPDAKSLVRLGRLASPKPISEFIQTVETTLDRTPLHLPGGPETVETVAWCSGGAQGYIQQAIDWQADVFLSGEVSEQTTHQALESGVHYLAAGHHATERVGVKALGEKLAQEFDLEVIFVDIPNPV